MLGATVQDVLDIVDVEGKREAGKSADLKTGGFDLIWDNGPVMQYAAPSSFPSMLGCYNTRDKTQLRRNKNRGELEGKHVPGGPRLNFQKL
jgi:hypothetical protein